MAGEGKGPDEDGYRSEFIRLVKIVKDMDRNTTAGLE